MKQVALDDITTDLPRYLRDYESILITCAGKPAGVLHPFASEEEGYDYLLENDPELLRRLFERANAWGKADHAS